MLNNIRYDLSDWLIHFFRDVSPYSDSGIDLPEHLGWSNILEDNGKPIPALFMLRCAIRHQRIWATWAYRGGKRTIYGYRPAVCFTEMPIAAFFEAAEIRSIRGQHISPYAIIINKRQMAQAGALPVIYGLSQQYAQNIQSIDPTTGTRIIDPSCMPLIEQYRYVSYQPASKNPIDWTHEREWRWPYPGDMTNYNKQMIETGLLESYEDVPALDLLNSQFNDIGIVVKTNKEKSLLLSDLLTLIDRGAIDIYKYKFILSLENIKNISNLRSIEAQNDFIYRSIVNPLDSLNVDDDQANIYFSKFVNIAKEIDNFYHIESGEYGETWLWLYDAAHPFTRSMIKMKRVIVNQDGRYLVKVTEFSSGRGYRQLEEMIVQLAMKLREMVNIECGYFTVIGCKDPNGVQFYCDPPLENQMFYNFNSNIE